jgi:hypothetical protein
MHAMLYAGKRQELDQKSSSLMMRDDAEDSAPPRSRVDLDSGRAVIRLARRDEDA